MAAAAKHEIRTGRKCDVCGDDITSFPMYHCTFCNVYDFCGHVACIRGADGMHAKYATVPINDMKELQVVMEHSAPTAQPHPPQAPGGVPSSPVKKIKVPTPQPVHQFFGSLSKGSSASGPPFAATSR